MMVIYNVMHEEKYVGTFYQYSFSTKEKAQQYIDSLNLEDENFGEEDKSMYSIWEHTVDSAS